MRNEVLEDDLLEVAVAGVAGSESFQRLDALLLGLSDANQDAARERNLQLACRFDRRESCSWVLGGRAGVDRLHQVLGGRLQHQSLRGGDLAQAS
jgi:hypothetical protein